MNRKNLILVVCILLLAQILAYSLIERKNTALIKNELAKVENEIRNLNSEEAQLMREIAVVDNIIKTIPANLLSGFEDPENGFAEFLDYLNNPIVEELRVEISLVERQKFYADPVALHKTKFNFKFGFMNTYEAERFFNFILHQDAYPIQVEDMKISRSGGKSSTTKVNMVVALYIPAKLQLPSNI